MTRQLTNEHISVLESFVTDQTQKIGIIVEILKELKEKGTIHSVSEEKLDFLNSLNIKEQPQTNVELIDLRPPKEKNKFLSMVATAMSSISNTFTFKKDDDFSWENLGYKVGVRVKNLNNKISEKNVSYQKLKFDLKNKASTLGVQIKESKVITSTNSFIEQIVLIGTKKNINQLNKKFKQDLEIIGFEAEDFFQHKNKTYLTQQEVMNKMEDRLAKKINLVQIDDNYTFDILNGLNTDGKFDMIKNVIWPTISKDLTQNLELAFKISDTLKNKSNDIQSLLKFSNKTGIHTDTIIHALKHNPELLSDKPGYDKILADRDSILKASDKYNSLVDNNMTVTKLLLNATVVLKNELTKINSSDAIAFIDTINNFTIATKRNEKKQDVVYTVAQLERNLHQISQPKNETAPTP